MSRVILLLSLILIVAGVAYAFPAYLDEFNATYGTSGSALNTCTLCHMVPGGGTRTPYGEAFLSSGHNFAAIENVDSDGDGFTNIDEIHAGTFPGDPSSVPSAAPTPTPAPTPSPAPPPAPAPVLESPMQAPSQQSHFSYQAVASPISSANPASAMPVGVGEIAAGGDTVGIHVSVGSFVSPVDLYLAFGLSTDPGNIYIMKSDYTVQAFSFAELVQAMATGLLPEGVVPWKKNSMGSVDEILSNITPVTEIPAGVYSFYLMATPSGNAGSFYLWQTDFSVAGLDGTALYGQNCAACHGALPDSTKMGRTSAAIQSAITGNMGGMGSLANLSVAQVDAISDVLMGVTPSPSLNSLFPMQPPSTQMLFPYPASASTLVSSDPSRARPMSVGPVAQGGDTLKIQLSLGKFVSPVDIYLAYTIPTDPNNLYVLEPGSGIKVVSFQEALQAVSTGSLPTGVAAWKSNVSTGLQDVLLGDTSVSQVPAGSYSVYMLATPAGIKDKFYLWKTGFTANAVKPDGAALYGQYCASCHGPLSSSMKAGSTGSMIQKAINNNFGGMGSLRNLSQEQVAAIAEALSKVPAPAPTPTPPPTTSLDGVTLYGTYCASCHGALASSTKKGRTAAQIQSGINNFGAMSGLSSLTSAQVSAIATALGSATTPAPTPTPPPTTSLDGASLYGTYCASCHGALASSTKGGRTAAQIQGAIDSLAAMSGLGGLTATQVSAIATALGSTAQMPTVPSHPSNWRNIHGDQVEKSGTTSCQSCHGTDLRGGIGPSCYSCHGKRW